MKQVSFKVAKALKVAGYPQEMWLYDAFYTAQGIYTEEHYFYDDIVAPIYLEAWLWLWRERKECIDIISAHNHDALIHINGELKGFNDPEEAIANAIEYLVNNNLIN